MPKLRAILTAFSLMIFAALVAHAQGAIVISVQSGQGRGAGDGSGTGTGTSAGVGAYAGGVIGGFGSGISGTPGQPFSADVIEETDRFLTDGNHIHREIHGRLFRDSQGRTRNESEIGSFGLVAKPFVHIMISDPVEGRLILLDPEQKTATVSQFGKRNSAAPAVSLPVQPVNNAAKSSAPTTAAAGPEEHLQSLHKLQATNGTQVPGKLHASHEDLGTMEIEGYTVTGTRFTRTIPAGQMGNDQPMTTTNERWFSQDLKMDLLNKSENPDSGKHIRKLVNIRLGDPDPLLFQVPADYTVKENPQQLGCF
jgi:hypothetical protein